MARSITIRRSDADALIKNAAECAPNESCALLVGDADTIKRVIIVENTDDMPQTRFSMSPEDLITHYTSSNIVGIFHSHPSSPARPSRLDIKYMGTNDIVWVIYSVCDRQMRAHILGESGEAEPIGIDTVS